METNGFGFLWICLWHYVGFYLEIFLLSLEWWCTKWDNVIAKPFNTFKSKIQLFIFAKTPLTILSIKFIWRWNASFMNELNSIVFIYFDFETITYSNFVNIFYVTTFFYYFCSHVLLDLTITLGSIDQFF